jgi:hypothetical protein
MATTHKLFGLGVKNIAGGAIDLDTDTFKISLHTVTYVPNQDTNDFFDDATNELATAGGYTNGGQTLATIALTYDTGTNEVRWDASVDPTWTITATVTFRIAVIRKARGGAASADELLSYIDFGADQSISSGTLTFTIDSTGLIKFTVA